MEALKPEDGNGSVEGAQPIKSLSAPTGLGHDGKRCLQVLVVRPFAAGEVCGGLRFAMPFAVWRCGKSGSGATSRNKKSKIAMSGPVPIHTVTKLHAMLFLPVKEKEGTGDSLMFF
jgi:hypothetical protein